MIQSGLSDEGWSQADLARKLGVSQQAVSRWLMSPTSKPRPRAVRQMASLFGWDDAAVARALTDDSEPAQPSGTGRTRPLGTDAYDLVALAPGASAPRRTLIIGAGAAGQWAVRQLLEEPSTYEPVALVDDAEESRGKVIHGVPVVGPINDVRRFIRNYMADDVLIAMPSAPSVATSVALGLLDLRISLRIVPRNERLLADPEKPRSITIEDILSYKRPKIDRSSIAQYVSGKTVVITGAGGYVGSALARHLDAYDPDHIVLADRSPNSLEAVLATLRHPHVDAASVDIRDRDRVRNLFDLTEPDLVIHAAGHRASLLLEADPHEAVTSNLCGLLHVVEAAAAFNVDRLVAVSTADAANPLSVVGQTRWLGERLVASRCPEGADFSSVRFSDLLDSPYGIVRRMLGEVSAGTDISIPSYSTTRQFLWTDDAAEMLLNVACQRFASSVLALDVGARHSLRAVADTIVALNSKGRQNAVVRIGRPIPGDNTNKELVGPREISDNTGVAAVLAVKPEKDADISLDEVNGSVASLKRLVDVASSANSADIRAQLRSVVSPALQPRDRDDVDQEFA